MTSNRATHQATGSARRAEPAKQPAWRACALALTTLLGLALVASPYARAQTFTVLYSFAGYPTDGEEPYAGLVMDRFGNLYGTTEYGGSGNCPSGGGCGTVFKLDTNGNETVLYSFSGADGANPLAKLIIDAKGDLYGTTEFGGRLDYCYDSYFAGCGVVFKLSGTKETVLYSFCALSNCADGAYPMGGLVMDASGALYSTDSSGGDYGNGVVFKLAGKKFTILHSFTNYPDGANPTAGLVMDRKGNLYGTTLYGGDLNCDPSGCGVAFKVAGKGTSPSNATLYAFGTNNPDGAYPFADLFMDAKGNLYSTTTFGGSGRGNGGAVFEVSRSGKERLLYSFQAYTGDGYAPYAGVVRDAAGNVYGTTQEGGEYGAGIAYKISRDGKETILHNLCSLSQCADGVYPDGDLIMDAKGNLYGTAYGGGTYKWGVVFKITP